MFRFSLFSLMVVTALLMVLVVLLAHAPRVALIPFLVPGICACLFLPFIGTRILRILTDPTERTFESDQLQNSLWAMFVCLLTICPAMAFLYSFITWFY